MRALLLAITAIVLGTLNLGPAQAAGGCGIGLHRGFYGACRPNGWGYGGRFFHPGYGYHYRYHWGRRWHRW